MEWPLHTAAYEARRECKAVLHAHSMTLVAFSLARYSEGSSDQDPRVPDTRVLLGAYQACGKVQLAPYELPGSNALAERCRKAFAAGADCVILQNHGVVVVGKNMHQAYDRFVSLEYLARSIVNSIPLGRSPRPLPAAVLKYATDVDNKSQDNPFPKPIPNAFIPKEPRLIDG
jgi:L-fuculose-phosphate aldolase